MSQPAADVCPSFAASSALHFCVLVHDHLPLLVAVTLLVLSGMVGAIGSNLFDYIMDKHATHVARALLVVIAGRDVLSPVAKKKQQQQQQQQIEAEGSEHQLAAAAAAAGNTPAFKSKRSSLQEKLSGRCSVDVAPGRYPSLLRRYAKMLPCYDASNMSMLGKNSYSSPFIQAVLRAAAGDE